MAKYKLKTKKFDPADYLDSPAMIRAYLDEIFESGDPALIAHGLGVVARARGMAKVAKRAGLTRESLYKALSAEGNPEFATVVRVLEAMDLKLGTRAA
ncbi:MAG: putative addiction module antidote protein [Rhizobiales bacterium]|nr:putative addiction module antidote protein [Hyphomicrobiales bacterium]